MTNGRGGAKMPAARAVDAIMRGLGRGDDEIYVGKARLIPLMARIAPEVIRGILRRG